MDETPTAGGTPDARLVTQLGMLLFLVYVAFLGVWSWRTRRLRAVGAGLGVTLAARRLRGWWGERVARARAPANRRAPASAKHDGVARRHQRPEPQLTRRPGDVARPLRIRAHLVEDAAQLRWPLRVHKRSAHELESASGALVVSVAAVGCEPVQPRGPWWDRRYVRRPEDEPPPSFARVGVAPKAATASPDSAAGSERAADPEPEPEASERAPRGANRDAVLRAVAARRGLTMDELAGATSVKPSSLPKLLWTLTLRGELEKIVRPDGHTGYVLTSPDRAAGEEEPP